MKDLEKAYRDAPKLESPPRLDRKIMQAAHARAGQSEGKIRPDLRADHKSPSKQFNSRWWVAGYAVSYLCIFGIGFGVLWQSGFLGGNPVEPEYDVVAIAPQSDESVVTRDALNEETQIASQVQSYDVSPSASAVSTEADVVAESFSVDSDAVGIPLSSDIEARPQIASVETARIESVEIRPVAEQESAQAHSAESFGITTEDAIVDELTGLNNSEPEISTLSKSASVDQNEARRKIRIDEKPIDGRYAESLNWVRMQNPDNYTVQLGTAGDDSRLESIAAQIGVSTFLIPWNSGPKEWLLLHGSFTDRVLAKQVFVELLETLESLPQTSVEVVPQLVTFGEIQQRLK